ncbi:alpha-L-arabinofuranosidase 1-like [Telopea speciosissima]|uniref:alpha-L-arabinofuranosidase 1-like n=1 Tax=Telopea speciosissima TaxID=54955 RepID=UPI001CC55237|nr:alpha-L-arabinofuranosidase 1-like [Telopea speciosissima]
MASYAPLFVNANDRRWNPDAFVSSQQYGTLSYWMQPFFVESNGSMVLNTTLEASSLDSLTSSGITWKNMNDNNNYIRIKIVNFGGDIVNLKITVNGLDLNSIGLFVSTETVLASNNLMNENSFKEPKKDSLYSVHYCFLRYLSPIFTRTTVLTEIYIADFDSVYRILQLTVSSFTTCFQISIQLVVSHNPTSSRIEPCDLKSLKSTYTVSEL